MSLKPQSDKIPQPLPSSPTWGELADTDQPVSVVVFECAATMYSYPYHTLSRWVLTVAPTATLRIRAGGDEVTIHGRNLKSISDALNSSRLKVIRETTGRYLHDQEVVVNRISVTTSSTIQ